MSISPHEVNALRSAAKAARELRLTFEIGLEGAPLSRPVLAAVDVIEAGLRTVDNYEVASPTNVHAQPDTEARQEQQPCVKQAPIDWVALEGREPPPRIWWLQDWLSPTPTLLAGAGGKGKSSIAQTLGTALATARNYISTVANPLRVLMWSCEDDADEIWRRQVAICNHFGIVLSDLEDALTIVPRVGLENTLFATAYGKPEFTGLLGELYQQASDYKADVVILDNIAQVFGANPNDLHHVTKFVNGIHGLVRDRPFASVFLGHTARAEGSEFMGSAAWENACRMRWYLGSSLPDSPLDLSEPVDPNTVFLAKRKANYSAKDYVRLRFRNGLFIPDAPEGARFDAGYQDTLVEEVVWRGMTKLLKVGVQTTDGPSSPDYLPKQMIAKGYGESYSKRELAGGMNRLMGVGRLARGPIGTYANRATKYGLVMVQS